MTRRTRATTQRSSAPPPSPVITRHILEDLHPSRRSAALAMSAAGTPNRLPDPTRIRITGPGSFEILPVKH